MSSTNAPNPAAGIREPGREPQAGSRQEAVRTSRAMGSDDAYRDSDLADRPLQQVQQVRQVRQGGAPRSHAGPLESRDSVATDGLETQRILTVFGSNSRGGYWEPPERLEVVSIFGGVKLDFTDANLYSGVTILNCFALFGGIEVIVPSDLEVDANGTGLFGGFDVKAVKKGRKGIFSRRRYEPVPDVDYDPTDEPPVLRIRGYSLFGGVAVQVR